MHLNSRVSNAMVALRLIPCLDVAKGRVVKGVNFVGLRDAGDPVELACRYSQAGADELVFLDIAASHEGRATLVEMVQNIRRGHDSLHGWWWHRFRGGHHRAVAGGS